MKKIIFGSASAILAVIGFSAFKTAKTTATTYYWFQINTGDAALIGTSQAYDNAELALFSHATTVAVSASPCSLDNVYQCLVGYTATEIKGTPGSYTLKTSSAIVPVTAPHGTNKTAYVREAQ